ncbi:MAE_28990/MAE_18760 family HEPN-like nuclease [Streptomyces sp. NPDC008317]|uniref:MAE_28990/MAE_18760 family HEPN-like nuclease n=1 Tax=Streptomyces sp. NPDC008317 TaxID=3364827 RepID=UPI0036E82A74
MESSAFVDGIDRQLARRKVELSNLTLMVKGDNPDPHRLSCIARSAIVLAYAHWEGFVKQSSSDYVNYVNGVRIKVSELKFSLQAAHVSSSFKRAAASSKTRYLGEMLEEIDRRRNEIFKVSPEKCIDTESNLSSLVFKDILRGIGLDVLPLYETRSVFIDRRLVKARNQVAHGELVSFDAVDVEDRIDGVRLLIDSYAEQLKKAVASNEYINGQ